MQALCCAVQKYAWGKTGRDSAVARIKESSDPRFTITESDPYAELWMGTHPNGPSTLSSSGVSLLEWLQDPANAGMVGSVPEGYQDSDIPFMFKILSIRTALSIQAHPDKAFAPILHARQPDMYKDSNHKPEMCVALTSLEAMKGFRPLREIRTHLEQFPELQNLVGQDSCEEFMRSEELGRLKEEESERKAIEAKALETLFGAFLRCPEDRASACVRAVVDRLRAEKSDSAYLPDLILRLHDDYPGDPGIFGPLLLNCLQLTPGQAFFMQANEPHAYIKGDIVEVMALSDNVVRAGLTPKFKDVETLCKMLEYRCIQDVSQCLVTPIELDPFCTLYRPPFSSCQEFEVERVTLPADATTAYAVKPLPCASILIFIQGSTGVYKSTSSEAEDTPINDGSVFFLGAHQSITVFAAASPLLWYRAHINLGST